MRISYFFFNIKICNSIFHYFINFYQIGNMYIYSMRRIIIHIFISVIYGNMVININYMKVYILPFCLDNIHIYSSFRLFTIQMHKHLASSKIQ